MAFKPFIYNANTGQFTDPNSQSFYSGGPQQTPHPYLDQLKNAGVAFGTIGGVTGAGYLLQRMGLPVADVTLGVIRRVEEYSPGQVLRTFQVGNIFSQFSSKARASRSISPAAIQEMSERKDKWLVELLSRTKGYDHKSAMLKHGLQFRDGSLYAGDKVIFKHASIARTVGQPRFVMGYSRAHSGLEIPLEHGQPTPSYTASFLKDVDYFDEAGKAQKEAFYILGAQSKSSFVWGQARGYAAEAVDRFNRLAQSPIEMEPFKTVFERVNKLSYKTLGFGLRLGVTPGAAAPTLGRIATKWGIGATAAIAGYKALDWGVRQSSIFDGTILGEGITAGIATAGIKANLAAATVADAIPGVRQYQEFQEEAAPGSTSLHRLAAWPVMGMLAGSISAFAKHANRRRQVINDFMKGSAVDYNHALRLASEQLSHEARQWGPGLFDQAGKGFARRFKGGKLPLLGKITPTKWRGIVGFTMGAALALPFIPGALIPEKTEEELRGLYSGRDLVPIRKGRFWEFGRTPHEGTKIDYWRPHWYPLMISRAVQKGVWGADEDEMSPLTKFYKKEFTYDWERENYYNRPYPITGTFGEDIPIVGPLVAATLGRLIKPPMLMHEDEWKRGDKALRHVPRPGEEYAFELGEIPPGTPAQPYSLTKLLGEQAYRLQEMVGLVGFATGATKQAITGSEGFADQEEVLQSARRGYGAERAYWDLDIGGAFGTTELIRRLFPHRRREIPEYNPLRNTMPDWLPGPGERSPDFLHGDPYTQVKLGEIRLPGAGYEALHPELKGVAPEDYPLLHKYSILSDVAPYSDQTKFMGLEVKKAIESGQLGTEDQELFKQLNERMIERKQNKEFYEYQYLTEDADYLLPGAADQSKEALAILNKRLASKKEEPGAVTKLFGSYWESLIKAAYSPFEFATPIAPAHKLMALRSAIESYEDTQVYGTEAAFWQKPFEQFAKPFGRTFANFLGWEGVPEEIQQRRGINEYFDILKYIKAKGLEGQAIDSNKLREAAEYSEQANETLTGLNPYAFNFQNIYRALPREERDYFKAFSQAKNLEERERILELVPENERRLYQGRWMMNYIQEMKAVLKKKDTPEETKALLEQEIQKSYEQTRTQGYPVSDELWERYMSERERNESYADWYRRVIYIPEKLKDVGLPGPDWVGWHPSVDLNDVKLKLVDTLGLDMYTFDLWQSDVRRAAYKEFLDEPSVIEEVTNNEGKSIDQVREEIQGLLDDMNLPQTSVIVTGVNAESESFEMHLDVTENRRDELRRRLREDIG